MAAQGIYTDAYRAKLAQVASGSVNDAGKALLDLSTFAVGEGGWTLMGSNKVPVTPTGAETDLEANVDPGDSCATGNERLRFEKAIGGANISDNGAGVLTIVCILDATETGLDSNSKLSGNCAGDPELFEIGLFDENGDMMVYATFDERVKQAGVAEQFTIVVTH